MLLLAAQLAAIGEELPNRGPAISAVEQFKAFLASPPPIENLVFREKLAPDLAKPRPYDGSFAKSTNFALFAVAWQKDALLMVQITNENARPEFLPDRRFISIYGGEHWLLEPGRYIETCTAPFGSFTNQVTIGIALNIVNLHHVLQGGIMHVRPGDITWLGNHFFARDVLTPHKLKFRVEGELLESEGHPSEMLVRYSTGKASPDSGVRWRVKYFYERELGAPFFPSRIKAFCVRGEAEVEMDDFEILKLELAEHPLPRSLFDPAPMLADHPVPVRLFTNGAMYEVLADGRLEKLYATSGSRRFAHRSTRLDPQLALFGLGAVNFLFLVLLLKTRKSRTNT